MDRRELERAVGAVIVPAVGPAGAHVEARPAAAYLRRHPPAGVIACGDAGEDPRPLLEAVAADLEACGERRGFVACALEQGAGQHFTDATRLPPPLALAAAAAGVRGGERRGLARVRAAGALASREARARGVDLALAPFVDLEAPGVAASADVRGFGDEPGRVPARASAFLEGLVTATVAGCALRIAPGLLRPTGGKAGSAAGIEALDLEPYSALVGAGVAAVRVGGFDLDARSLADLPVEALLRVAVEEGIRRGLGFDGVVLARARDGAAAERTLRPNALRVACGCDGLLGPPDPAAVARELVDAVEAGDLPAERLEIAAGRMRALRERLTEQAHVAPSVDAAEGRRFAAAVADAALCLSVPRWAWKPGRPCEVLAPLHQSRDLEARAGLERLRRALAGSPRPAGVVLPVVSATRDGSRDPGSSPGQLEEIEAKIASLRSLGWKVALVWLASPRTLPAAWWGRPDLPVLVAFAPTPPLLEAVERWLRGRSRAGGSLPCALG